MGAVLLRRADWHDECGALQQALADQTGIHFLQPPGARALIHRRHSWVMVILVAGVAAAEWLRQPAPVWVALAWVCVAAAVATLWPLAGWRRRILAALLLALAVTLTPSQRQLSDIETRWPDEREHRVSAAFQHLEGDLRSVLDRAERLAQAATQSAPSSRAEAFQALDRLVPRGGPQMSVVGFDQQGPPRGWAGRHRVPAPAPGAP